MGYRCTLRNVGTLVGALLALAAITASSALAQVGLPPSYDVQRIDPPNPRVGGGFGSGAASAGDVDGDGKDDFLAYQVVGSPNADGEVYVISGATGDVIDTIAAPDPGGAGNRANFGFPYLSKLGTNEGNSTATFTDLVSCPGATPTASPNKPLCEGNVGPPDGIPEILVGARGVDAKGKTDAGRVYVFDGRTRALLKRIDMPAADVTDVTLGTGVRRGGTWFGRSVIAPAGQPGCAGNSSVGPCQAVPRAVKIGDMDGQGRPDLIIGASATTENPTTAHPESQCARLSAPDANCIAAGRAYIFRGEEIVGSSPAEILDGTTNGDTAGGSNGTETFKRLKNQYAQSAGGSQLFANSVSAIGDVGSCNLAMAPGIGPGDPCPEAASTTAPDGKPDVVVGALRVDLPFDMPGGDLLDAGVSLLVDGATGTVLRTYQSPAPQNRAVFGTQFQQPAAGDMGGSPLPDAYIPAPAEDTEAPTGGRGYVMDGNFKASDPLISRISDPTPNAAENFGFASVGVGDLVGGTDNPGNELLVGSEGPFFVDPGFPPPPPPNDLHFFNGATGRVLQTIDNPDTPGSSFGSAVVGLGDLNGDGFLDFAVGAEQFSPPGGDREGRLYIFESQAPPTPPAPPAPPTPPAPLGAGPCGTPGGAGYLNPAKMRVSRARVLREDRLLDVLAPITSRARGGDVEVTYQGDGRSDTFDSEVTEGPGELDQLRFKEPITRGQARLGTGIVNLNYLGDADTRPEFVRLRAASRRAGLDVEKISLIGDRLSGQGSVTSLAEGVVRFQYSYVAPDGSPQVHEARAEIQDDGDWELENDQVPAQLAQCGGYLSIQFTGFFERRIRGEQLAYELNAGQTRRP